VDDIALVDFLPAFIKKTSELHGDGFGVMAEFDRASLATEEAGVINRGGAELLGDRVSVVEFVMARRVLPWLRARS
jgi:hypothetical protein